MKCIKIKAFNRAMVIELHGDIMNLNLIAAILSIIVVAIGLYEIFGLGQHTWSDYLSVILFAIVFILEIRIVLNQKT